MLETNTSSKGDISYKTLFVESFSHLLKTTMKESQNYYLKLYVINVYNMHITYVEFLLISLYKVLWKNYLSSVDSSSCSNVIFILRANLYLTKYKQYFKNNIISFKNGEKLDKT